MITQDMINSAWVMIAKATELVAADIDQAAASRKDADYASAVKLESAAESLKATSANMRERYPHLFDGDKENGTN